VIRGVVGSAAHYPTLNGIDVAMTCPEQSGRKNNNHSIRLQQNAPHALLPRTAIPFHEPELAVVFIFFSTLVAGACEGMLVYVFPFSFPTGHVLGHMMAVRSCGSEIG